MIDPLKPKNTSFWEWKCWVVTRVLYAEAAARTGLCWNRFQHRETELGQECGCCQGSS